MSSAFPRPPPRRRATDPFVVHGIGEGREGGDQMAVSVLWGEGKAWYYDKTPTF